MRRRGDKSLFLCPPIRMHSKAQHSTGCTAHSVQCTDHIAQYPPHSAHCSALWHSVQHATHSTQCTLQSIQRSTAWQAQCIKQTALLCGTQLHSTTQCTSAVHIMISAEHREDACALKTQLNQGITLRNCFRIRPLSCVRGSLVAFLA